MTSSFALLLHFFSFAFFFSFFIFLLLYYWVFLLRNKIKYVKYSTSDQFDNSGVSKGFALAFFSFRS